MTIEFKFDNKKVIFIPAASKKSYELHKIAVEFGLGEPILITDEKDIKATNWKEAGLAPFKHQVENLITFCRHIPVAMIADEVGLGKTISAAIILSELMVRKRVKRTFIVAPKILLTQWQAELEEKFKIKSVIATGRNAVLEAISNKKNQVILTTYQTATYGWPPVIFDIKQGDFQLCILDEAHKLKNLFGSVKPSNMATYFYKLLNQETRIFPYMLMLTATPVQNNNWELYSLMHLLQTAKGAENPLGNEEYFRSYYLYGNDGKTIHPSRIDEFRLNVRSLIHRTRKIDVDLPFPDRYFSLPLNGELGENDGGVSFLPDEKICYNLFIDYINNSSGINGLQRLSLIRSFMSSPNAFITAVNKRDIQDDPELVEIRDILSKIRIPSKAQRVLQIIELIKKQNPVLWRVVIFTERIETLKMLGRIFQEQGYAYGTIQGSNVVNNKDTIKKYGRKKDEIPEINIVISTDAGSEGINLQAGNILINYDLPWNPMKLEQRIGRVQRLSSGYDKVFIINMYVKESWEANVVLCLMNKLICIKNAIGSIESILNLSGYSTSEKDGEKTISFEKCIEQYVYDVFQGRNEDEAIRKIERNIEAGLRLYEENKNDMDTLFGSQKIISETDRLKGYTYTRKPLTKTPKEFVLDACILGAFTDKEDGKWKITKKDDNHYILNSIGNLIFHNRYIYGSKYQISFDENEIDETLEKNTVSGCQGEPFYESLLQYWQKNNSQYVYELNIDLDAANIYVSEKWKQEFPDTKFLRIYDAKKIDSEYNGNYLIHAVIENGVDRLEKICDVNLLPTNSSDSTLTLQDVESMNIYNNNPKEGNQLLIKPSLMDKPLKLTNIDNIVTAIEGSVSKDEEINGFNDYYRKRYDVDIKDAGTNYIKCQKIKNDFIPMMYASICGTSGLIYYKYRITVKYTIDEQVFEKEFDFQPVSKQFNNFPLSDKCSLTGYVVPKDDIGICDITGVRILKHRLIRLDDGRKVCPELIMSCEICGENVLKSDAVICSVSHKSGHKKHFIKCSITKNFYLPEYVIHTDYENKDIFKELVKNSDLSGRTGYEDNFVVCTATGRTVLIDEAVKSKATGDWYCKDQLQKSAASDKLALPCDMVQCELTGDWILPEELVSCIVSKNETKNVRFDIAERSCISGKYFLPECGIKCNTGESLLPNEVCNYCGNKIETNEKTIPDPVNSERLSHAKDFVHYVSDGSDILLPRENAFFRTKDFKWYPKSLGEFSDLSHIYGLPEDLITCEFTGTRVLFDESVVCAVSGKRVRNDIVILSPISAKPFLPEYGLKCKTGEILLPSEVCNNCGHKIEANEPTIQDPLDPTRLCHASEYVIYNVSEQQVNILKEDAFLREADQRWYPKAIGEKSALSGRYGLLDDFITCEETGDRVFQNETTVCRISGKRVRKDIITISSLSNKPFLTKLGVKNIDGELFLPEEVCNYCGEVIKPSDRTIRDPNNLERFCHASEFVPYESDEKCVYIPKKEAFQRESDKKWYPLSLGEQSAYSGKYGLPEDMVTCEETGHRIFIEESTVCSISGKRVRNDITNKSPVSHKLFLPEYGVKCNTGELLLPTEVCSYCLGMIKCNDDTIPDPENPGRLCHAAEFVLAETPEGEKYFPKKAAFFRKIDQKWYPLALSEVSELTGNSGLPEDFVTCAVTGRKILLEEAGQCSITGLTACLSILETSPISNKRFIQKYGIKCSNGQYLPPDEVCELCNEPVYPNQEVFINEDNKRPAHKSHYVLSRENKYILKDSSVKSDYSGYYGLKTGLIHSESGRIGFPDEFCRCSLTGHCLLKDEVVFSERDQKFYDKNFCVQSSYGIWGLKQDSFICPVSKEVIFPENSAICTISGKVVNKKCLRKSPVSGKLFREDLGELTADNKLVMPSEIEISAFDCKKYAIGDIKKCLITQKNFHKSYLDNLGRVKILGVYQDDINNDDFSNISSYWMKANSNRLAEIVVKNSYPLQLALHISTDEYVDVKALKNARIIDYRIQRPENPDGVAHAFCFTADISSMFGLKKERVYCIGMIILNSKTRKYEFYGEHEIYTRKI